LYDGTPSWSFSKVPKSEYSVRDFGALSQNLGKEGRGPRFARHKREPGPGKRKERTERPGIKWVEARGQGEAEVAEHFISRDSDGEVQNSLATASKPN